MPPTKAKNPPPAEQAATEQVTTEAAAADQVTKAGEAPAGTAPIEPAVTEAAPIEPAVTEAAPVEPAVTEAAPVEPAVTEAAPVEPPAPAAPQFTHLITAVPEKGFCRAGRRWYRDATHVNRDDFSAEDWAALEAEPMLVVVSL
jgi:hypothetical protein